MVLVFPCAGFQNGKGFQWDAENLGLGLPCTPNQRRCIFVIMYKKYRIQMIFKNELSLVTTERSQNFINVHLGYKQKRLSEPLAC